MAQTVTECLAAGTDSVTLINDINTNGKKSTYVGGSAEADTTMSQADINETVQRNVDHLSTILLYEPVDADDDMPDVKGAASNLKTTHVAAVTTGTDYIAANDQENNMDFLVGLIVLGLVAFLIVTRKPEWIELIKSKLKK